MNTNDKKYAKSMKEKLYANFRKSKGRNIVANIKKNLLILSKTKYLMLYLNYELSHHNNIRIEMIQKMTKPLILKLLKF